MSSSLAACDQPSASCRVPATVFLRLYVSQISVSCISNKQKRWHSYNGEKSFLFRLHTQMWWMIKKQKKKIPNRGIEPRPCRNWSSCDDWERQILATRPIRMMVLQQRWLIVIRWVRSPHDIICPLKFKKRCTHKEVTARRIHLQVFTHSPDRNRKARSSRLPNLKNLPRSENETLVVTQHAQFSITNGGLPLLKRAGKSHRLTPTRILVRPRPGFRRSDHADEHMARHHRMRTLSWGLQEYGKVHCRP